MLTLNLLRENSAFVVERLKIKGFDAKPIIDQIIETDEKWRILKFESDQKQAELNTISKTIGQYFKEGKKEDAELAREKSAVLKDEIKQKLQTLVDIEKNLNELIVQLPNIPHESVPPGTSAKNNEPVFECGRKPKLSQALPHWELASKYKLIDFELGNKLTGAGFPVYLGKGAKLQRALINYFLDKNLEAGYTEVLPPLMVNEDSGFGTGQLPDKEGQMYHVSEDNFYLIPTAEVPVTNIYRDVILEMEDLPIKKTAYTPCFRREAGSYGKDVRGLNRLHQFDKVEIVQIQHPDRSYQTLEEMKEHVKTLVEDLKLPYRIMRLCGGDMSFASALTYDFEVYSAAQKRWLEVSSVSNFETFQANRLKLRIRDNKTKKKILAHSLNGSALALPRIVAALLENNQTAEGIRIPEKLVPYTGFDFIS